MTPFFSVVVPLYNKADTISRAIGSVLGQTFRDFEIVVVDDGSTDGSLELVRMLICEVPLRIVTQANAGVSAARNRGAQESLGKYIALLDADDVWRSSHLQDLAIAIEKKPGLGLYGTGYERFVRNWVYFTIPWPWLRVADVVSLFRYGQPVNSSSVAIDRRLWLSQGGFDRGLRFYEDYEFFFRLGELTKMCIVPRPSARYMDDAKDQATRRQHGVNREHMPHLAFVEGKMSERRCNANVMAYGKTQGRLMACWMKAQHDQRALRDFQSAFPVLSRCAADVSSVVARVYLCYYRLRNHLIIWRRHR